MFYVDVANGCSVCEMNQKHLICLWFLTGTRYAVVNASHRKWGSMLGSCTITVQCKGFASLGEKAFEYVL